MNHQHFQMAAQARPLAGDQNAGAQRMQTALQRKEPIAQGSPFPPGGAEKAEDGLRAQILPNTDTGRAPTLKPRRRCLYDAWRKDVRSYLYSCRDAVHDLRSIERQRDAIRFPGMDLARPSYAHGSRDRDATTTALNQMDYYDALLAQKREELAREFLCLEDILSHLDNHVNRAILRYYFALGMSNQEVADQVGLTDRTTGEKRRAAIRWLERNVGEGNSGGSG